MTDKKSKTNLGLMIILLVIILIGAILLSSFGYKIYLERAYPKKYDEYVTKYSRIYQVDPSLVYAVIKTESNFNHLSSSHAGAIGLMQLTPETFKWLQKYTNDNNMDEAFLKDQETNIKYGTLFISKLMGKYKDVETALCAYNAGMGTVDKWLNDKDISVDGKKLKYIPYSESNLYVKRCLESRRHYKELYYK